MLRQLLALLALACAAPSLPPQQSMTETEKAECIAQGGLVERQGKAQIESCRTRYADGGKACTDKSDCEGVCNANLIKPGTPHPVGECQRYSGRFGCQSYLEKGVIQEMCVD